MKQQVSDPYRIFFLLGLLFGLWGVAIWIPFGLGWSTSYPGLTHPQIMIGGFLSAFAFGFLMTAIPRFTQSFAASRLDVTLVGAPLMGLPLAVLAEHLEFMWLALLLSFLGLLRFAVTRFLARKAQPPSSFIFLGVGLITAPMGLILQLLSHWDIVGIWGMNLGRDLFLQCFMLALVVGVGSRLVPMLLGWGALFAPSHNYKLFVTLALLFVGSYLIDAFSSVALMGSVIRALLSTFIMLKFWHIQSFPQNRSRVGWGLWVSAWSLLIGLWGLVLWPQYRIHFLHLEFIAGMGLLTLMVAVRVVLAHGGYSLMLETQYRPISCMTWTLVAAGIIRLAAGVFPSHYQTFLAYAALTWIAALLIWAYSMGLKIIKPLNSSPEQC